MRVVDIRDFDIPSDDNDYDELVAFADTMAEIEPFDAMPMDKWKQLKETITEICDNNKYDNEDVTEVCVFLLNYMKILESECEECI